MRWYLTVLRRYARFTGRAGRRELWMFVLITALVWILLVELEGLLGFDSGVSIYQRHDYLAGGHVVHALEFGPSIHSNGPLLVTYLAATLLPWLAVSARRLHDTNLSGWWQLLALIPILGWSACAILYTLPGTLGANAYGPDPRDETVAHRPVNPVAGDPGGQ